MSTFFIYLHVSSFVCYHFPFSNMCSNFIYCLVLLPFPFFNMYSYNIYCLILLPYSFMLMFKWFHLLPCFATIFIYLHISMISFIALFCHHFHLATCSNYFIHCIVLQPFPFFNIFKHSFSNLFEIFIYCLVLQALLLLHVFKYFIYCLEHVQ